MINLNMDVMFSSKSDQWATPIDFFRELDAEFHFNLDPAADENNHKCDTYFTVKENGLLQLTPPLMIRTINVTSISRLRKMDFRKNGGAITCFAIRRMGGKLGNGLKKHTRQIKNPVILWLCFFQRGQIQNGSMILYTTARKCVSFAGA